MIDPGSKVTTVGGIQLEEGLLSSEQIDLVLSHLPFDNGFLDAEHRLVYANHGQETLAVIESSATKAHETGSTDRNETFVIDGDDHVHQSSSFAVRGADGHYQGALLVNQDINTVRSLTGERRILDWEEP